MADHITGFRAAQAARDIEDAADLRGQAAPGWEWNDRGANAPTHFGPVAITRVIRSAFRSAWYGFAYEVELEDGRVLSRGY